MKRTMFLKTLICLLCVVFILFKLLYIPFINITIMSGGGSFSDSGGALLENMKGYHSTQQKIGDKKFYLEKHRTPRLPKRVFVRFSPFLFSCLSCFMDFHF